MEQAEKCVKSEEGNKREESDKRVECDRKLEECARLGKGVKQEEYTKWLEVCAKNIKPQFFEPSVVHTAHEIESCYPKDSKYYELEKIILNSGILQWDYKDGGFKAVTLAPARLVAQTILWDLYEEGFNFLPEILTSVFGGFYFQWNCRTLRIHGNGKITFFCEETMIGPTWWRFVIEECIKEIILFCNPNNDL